MTAPPSSSPPSPSSPSPPPDSPAHATEVSASVSPAGTDDSALVHPRAADVRRIQTISRWLDERYLDPIIGFLLPVVGDVVPVVFGLYVLVTAVRLGLPGVVIARMVLNIAADVVLGVNPVVGDLIDIGFRAHRRNTRLLLAHYGGDADPRRDWLVVGAAAALLLLVLALPVAFVLWGAGALYGWLFS